MPPLPGTSKGTTMSDNWKHRSQNMRCKTCMFFVPKVQTRGHSNVQGYQAEMTAAEAAAFEKVIHEAGEIGRCRRHAPTMNGFPVVFVNDWCGDHKLDEEKTINQESDPLSKPGSVFHWDPWRDGVPANLALQAIEILAAEVLKARGFHCIYDREMGPYGYCDDCPLSENMLFKNPIVNNWSEISKLFCRKEKRYSK